MYLLFSEGKSIFTKGISFITWGDYTHVEAVTDKGYLIGSDFHSSGVNVCSIQRRSKESKRMLLVRVKKVNSGLFIKYLKSQLGKPYDTLASLGYVFRKNWNNEDRWFCSELIAKASQVSGNPLIPEEPFRATPRDLLLSDKLQKVSSDKEEIINLILDLNNNTD